MMRSTWLPSHVAVALVCLMILLTATLTHFLRDLLLAPERVSAITGPQEGYYWTAAQYQIALLQLENQALVYASGKEHDADALRMRYEILQSKFRILASPSELNRFFREVPDYEASRTALETLMDRLDADIATITSNPRAIDALLADIQGARPIVNTFASNTRAVEIKRREIAFADFHAKRRAIFVNGAVLLCLFAVAVLLLIVAFRRYRDVIRQQRIALEAEHRATDAARSTIRAKNAFLAMVSHELRTPLQSITAAVDVLADSLQGTHETRVLKRLESASLQLTTQMKDLTDYVRLEVGSLELRHVPFFVAALIERALNDALPLAERKGLVLRSSNEAASVGYLSDPERISQILANLLTNAIKYTERGEILLRVFTTRRDAQSDTLTIEVTDTGAGIASDKLEQIFEPFTRLDQSSTRLHDGFGMGLSIVKGLVALLQGEVAATSRIGEGSSFRVTIALTRDATHASDDLAESVAVAQPARCRVLVVDDNEAAREAFGDLLGKLDVVHESASNADEALARLASTRFDLVLLDIEMPGKDGRAVAREVKRRPGPNRETRIVAISAHAPELADADSEARHLFNEYLLKPVRLHTLRALLADIANTKEPR
ncbi:ATP-binding protein [Trinickia fusca]|nr:ATP-binding protein [Trinickia fusca]